MSIRPCRSRLGKDAVCDRSAVDQDQAGATTECIADVYGVNRLEGQQ